MASLQRYRAPTASPWHGYAPREPYRELMMLIERLCAANHSNTCIVSIEKLRELLLAWFHLKRSRRSILYHLKAAAREMLIFRQTRWRAVGGRLVLKARTRYRIGWRHLQRLTRHARQCGNLLKHGAGHLRAESVQKLALGLEKLFSSLVPAAP